MYINDTLIHFVNLFMTSQSNVKCEDRNDNGTTRMNKNALQNPRAFEYNLDSVIIVNKLF